MENNAASSRNDVFFFIPFPHSYSLKGSAWCWNTMTILSGLFTFITFKCAAVPVIYFGSAHYVSCLTCVILMCLRKIFATLPCFSMHLYGCFKMTHNTLSHHFILLEPLIGNWKEVIITKEMESVERECCGTWNRRPMFWKVLIWLYREHFSKENKYHLYISAVK